MAEMLSVTVSDVLVMVHTANAPSDAEWDELARGQRPSHWRDTTMTFSLYHEKLRKRPRWKDSGRFDLESCRV